MQGSDFPNVQIVRSHAEKIQADLKKIGHRVKHHEGNLKFLKAQSRNIDESIHNIQDIIQDYHSSSKGTGESQRVIQQQSEQQTVYQILKQEKTAAGIIYELTVHHGAETSTLPMIKDVVGIVATLGKVQDDNLSRLLSEYLGPENMLAIVCKTYEGVRALEEYDKDGMINRTSGLHGFGDSIGRLLDDRFHVICLENLRTYTGDFVFEDSQKRLALLKPRLPSGESPLGFLGFAVNMINLDDTHLSCVMANGHGLRESLFYSLFSHLQVYRTRSEMQRALPYISGGAISLDGGIMRSTGLFSLGRKKDVDVKFPICATSDLHLDIISVKAQVRLMKWKKERLAEEMQREEALLNNEKKLFNAKEQVFMKNVVERRHYIEQTEGASTSAEPPSTATIGPGASHAEGILVEEVRTRDSEIQAMMDLIHTPSATGPTQSQLDDTLEYAEDLQGRLSQVEQERDSRIQELEAHMAASYATMARTQLEATFMRRLSDFCRQQLQDIEPRLMETEVAVVTVLPGADIAGLMPAPVAATLAGSGHSRALTVE